MYLLFGGHVLTNCHQLQLQETDFLCLWKIENLKNPTFLSNLRSFSH